MKERRSLSAARKLTAGSLMLAAVGVAIQIASGHDYPTIPPVFFILLIPAGLIVLVRRRWAPAFAVLAGLFLTTGLFASGESSRLWRPGNLGDSIGLWIQMLAVIVATIAAIIAIAHDPSSRASPS